MATDNAGIFFYGPPPTPAEICILAKGASITKSIEGPVTKIEVKWPKVSVTIFIDPAWKRNIQLSGIRGWIAQFPLAEQKSPAVTSFLADLDRTTTSYGSVISPGYDAGGKAASFLKSVLATSGGFFFSHQSFYTAKGARITGLTGDPVLLGAK